MKKKISKQKKEVSRKQKITKDMSIEDVVNKYPQTIEVFFKHGLHCIGCAAATFENIEQGAKAHDIDVETLMEELNNAAKKKR